MFTKQETTPFATDSTPHSDKRSFYGFDDIPIENEDMSDVRFVDILKAWVKRGVQHSALEKGAEKASEKKKRFDELKNDIKWAMQADLDEPVKPVIKQPTQPNTPKNVATTPTQPIHTDQSKTIDININFGALPKLPSAKKGIEKTRSHISKLLNRKFAIKAACGALIIGIGTASWFYLPVSPGALNKQEKSSTIAGSQTEPTYSTVIPSGKSITSLGGWKRVSPDDRDPVFAYADKINNVTINVSQQPLPSDFKKDTSNKVADLAKAYGATHEVKIGSNSMFIGSSADGPQSAILTKNDTLILMKSTGKIPDDAWASYVKSLQ